MQSDHRYVTSVAAAEAPRSLAWAAGIVAGLSLVNAFVFHLSATADALHAVAVVALLAGSFAARVVPQIAVPWLAAASAVVLVTSMQVEVHLDPSYLGIAYLLVLLATFGPFVHSVRAYAVAVLLLLPMQVIVADQFDDGDRVSWVVVSIVALLVGGIVLRLRRDAIVRLGRSAELVASLASHDDLTGVLNRRGLDARVDSLIAGAVRRGDDVIGVFVDVDGLKQANDLGGHARGDRILEAVAAAVSSTTRAADLVCRWGGDEFVMIGYGPKPDPDDLEQRIAEHPAVRAAIGPEWSGQVSVGVAALPAAEATLDRIVHDADSDMYARRLREAGGTVDVGRS